MDIRVSIIIPTHNRKEKLLLLLERLREQGLDENACEIIVVDDGSTDGTGEAVLPFCRSRPHVIYLPVQNQGQSAARNRGLESARGEFIAFTDDDCLPERDWIGNALPYFDDPAVGGVQGATYCDVRQITPLSMQVRNLEDGNYETCNMFYRRQALARAGPFDPVLRFYREDTDLAWRVLDCGYRIPFAPSVRVEHPPHHYSLWRLLKKRFRFRWAYYDRYFERKHPRRFRSLKLFGIFTPAIAAYYPVYLSLGLVLYGLFAAACPFGRFASLLLLLVSYAAVCLVFLNESARGIRLQLILARRRELLLFLSAWWLVMLGEIFFHLAGSVRFRRFSL